MLLLTFQAAGQRYAVDASRVVEVVPRVRLRALPHAPAHLAGVLEYRGEVVTVLDLGLLLGAEPAPDRLGTRIILVDRAAPSPRRRRDAEAPEPAPAAVAGPPRRSLLGLIAENVDDLASVDPDDLTASPVAIPNAPYLGGMAEIESTMVQLILVEKLLNVSPNQHPTPAD
ncbi:chemotaxis protein CheW [Planctomyces sp. SH-PL62]|uniref:chemotaxis protein CheW n=1 Tax=Planctomyces sp. SH-PL62 TaxID=1636152 RepID=UPI00078BC8AB|nr:chemotaxis protein CheW [Planctomyces sp. SH-PL62]AMV37849.1 purine-binding chemotaxis protein [Planctomyces sp. SH-PL62]